MSRSVQSAVLIAHESSSSESVYVMAASITGASTSASFLADFRLERKIPPPWFFFLGEYGEERFLNSLKSLGILISLECR